MASDEQLKQAVLESVERGAYPEPEVSSAELPTSLLPALLADLQKARDEVKVANKVSLVVDAISDMMRLDRYPQSE